MLFVHSVVLDAGTFAGPMGADLHAIFFMQQVPPPPSPRMCIYPPPWEGGRGGGLWIIVSFIF